MNHHPPDNSLVSLVSAETFQNNRYDTLESRCMAIYTTDQAKAGKPFLMLCILAGESILRIERAASPTLLLSLTLLLIVGWIGRY